MRVLKVSSLLVLIIFLSFNILKAQDIVMLLSNQFGVGARAMGMGGAFIAVSDDYSATYWNPAGLGQIKRTEFMGSLSHLINRDRVTFYQNTTSDEASFTKLNCLGLAYSVPTYRGSLVFALGFNRVKSFDSSFSFSGFNFSPEDSVFQSGNEFEKGGLRNWSLAGAVEVAKDFFVGAAINIWTGSDEYTEKFFKVVILVPYTLHTYSYEDKINTEFRGSNLKLGALYRADEIFKLGITISTPFTLKCEEEWTSDQYWSFDNGTPDSSDISTGFFEYKVALPYSLGLGVSLSLPGFLTIAGDIEYNDWTQVEYKTEPPLADLTREEANELIRSNCRATARLRAGAELSIPLTGVKLRGGAILDPSPFKDGNWENDRKFLTAGIGFLIGRQAMINLAWVRGWWKSTYGPLTEKIEKDKFFLTGAIRF